MGKKKTKSYATNSSERNKTKGSLPPKNRPNTPNKTKLNPRTRLNDNFGNIIAKSDETSRYSQQAAAKMDRGYSYMILHARTKLEKARLTQLRDDFNARRARLGYHNFRGYDPSPAEKRKYDQEDKLRHLRKKALDSIRAANVAAKMIQSGAGPNQTGVAPIDLMTNSFFILLAINDPYKFEDTYSNWFYTPQVNQYLLWDKDKVDVARNQLNFLSNSIWTVGSGFEGAARNLNPYTDLEVINGYYNTASILPKAVADTYTMIVPAVKAPLKFATIVGGGYLGSKATDKVVDWTTDYNSWSDMATRGWGWDSVAANLSNPGMWVGGWRGSKLGNNILGAVVTYKQAFPYMKLFIADNNTYAGLGNTVSRTIKSIPKFASPKFMKLMMLSPDMVKNSDLWWWSDFSKNLWRNLLSNWAKEAAKGKYYFTNSPNPGNSTLLIANAFETGRHTASGIEKAKKLALDVVDSYNKKMETITDPVLKHIAETSPLYLDEVYEQLLRGGATPDFVKDLIKKANSYRRAMRGENLTSEDFLTYRGRKSHSPISTIDVEGENMSGNYGSVQGYFEGQPELKGDISTWWDLRIPEGVNSSEVLTTPDGSTFTLESRVTPGMHYVEPYIKQITSLEPQGDQLPIILTFYDTYRQSGLPYKHVVYPTHQVFYGKTNTMLPNFKVTVGNRPFNFNYGKGYKQGGTISKLQPVERR